MERLFYSTFFLVVLLNALLIFTNLELAYSKYILIMHDHYLSSKTRITDTANRITRHCSKVTRVQPGSSDWNEVATDFNSRIPGLISTTRAVLQQGDWRLAEIEHSNLTPMILLYKTPLENLSSVHGYTAVVTPVVNAAAIQDYFFQHAPSAPEALIRCYDPVGYPFNEHPHITASSK